MIEKLSSVLLYIFLGIACVFLMVVVPTEYKIAMFVFLVLTVPIVCKDIKEGEEYDRRTRM